MRARGPLSVLDRIVRWRAAERETAPQLRAAASSKAKDVPPLLEVDGLRTFISTPDGVLKAVDGVSFDIAEGESVGLVGESGSGKTMTCLSMIRLLPTRSAYSVDGRVLYRGADLMTLSNREMRRIRGAEIAMIMQDPLAALNPLLTIGDQVAEPMRHHNHMSAADAARRTEQVLGDLRIPNAAKRMKDYPHQFSGGMRQRVVAAMGLGPRPSLIIADEPTTALDVTIQAQFIALMKDIQRSHGMAMLWITHDLGVVAQTCDRVNVMYAGRIVERGTVRQVLRRPRHPYTKGLIASIPDPDRTRERLYQIDGHPPDLANLGPGCAFYPRCPSRMTICESQFPPATVSPDGHVVHCWADGSTNTTSVEAS